MRIAIDISQIAYERTGVANYTAGMVRNLLMQDQENEYVLFGISLRKLNILEGYFNTVKHLSNKVQLKLLPVPQTLGNFIWNGLHLFDPQIYLGKIDVLHSSDWIQPPTRTKKITTVHDLVIYRYAEFSHPKIVETQKRRLFWVKKECDMILSDSFATKNDLTNLLKIDPDRIEVVYPGIGKEFETQNQAEIVRVKQKYHLSGDYILSVGTMEPRKNLQRVFTAYSRFLQHSLIANENKQIKLVVVGNVGWGPSLQFTKHIHLLREIPQTDLPALYSGAAFLVYPSLYEGFGLPVLEAMACNCPVVTSNRGSLQEVVADAALFVDPESVEDIAVKMTQLIIDDDLRYELINKGQKQILKFNWEKAARQIINIYQKL